MRFKMKTLVESLFDDDLTSRDLFDDPKFKEWINTPDILMEVYFYWTGDTDPILDYHKYEWKTLDYKSLADIIYNMIKPRYEEIPGGYIFYRDYEDKLRRCFRNEYDFNKDFIAAYNEVRRNATAENNKIWKMQFKGDLPKNSDVAYLFNKAKFDFEGLDGGVVLVDSSQIIVIGFPKGTNKLILKLFDII